MPTVFTHLFVGAVTGKAIFGKKAGFKVLVYGMLASSVMDADVIAFALKIPYEHMFGHRGFFHSFSAAFLLSLFLMLFFIYDRAYTRGEKWLIAFYFFLAGSLHAILDAMTSGGLGIALFSPFDNTRYFFPLRPIRVSPIGSGFFSSRGIVVIKSELLWVWIPSFILFISGFLFRRLSSVKHNSQD